MSSPYGAAATRRTRHRRRVAFEQVQVEVERRVVDRTVSEHHVHTVDAHRRGRNFVARGGVTASPHHRADRGVLHVREIDRVGVQRGIADTP